MKTKITAISIFLLIASAAMPVYYINKSANLEKNFIELLGSKNSAMKSVAEKLNKEQAPDSEKLKKLFNEIIARDRTIAAIAVTDRMERLRFMAKNDTILHSGRIVDELVKDIKEKNFSQAGENEPIIKNYSGTDWLTDKLYIYRFSSGGQSTIAVYSFTTDRLTGIRIALEVILLISGIFILTAGIVMIILKTGIIKENEQYRIRTIVIGEKSPKPVMTPPAADKKTGAAAYEEKADSTIKRGKTAAQIDENELSLIPESGIAHDDNSADKNNRTEKYSPEVLNRKVFTLFKKIHKRMSPESISLYIKMTETALSKSYELKGKSIIRIDSLSFDSISISEIEKISKPGTYITANGETVRIPLVEDGITIGLIEIKPGQNTSAVNISFEQSDINDITREINNFTITNNIITDTETGFYSSRYYVNSVTENINTAKTEGKEFSLLMINIFAGVDADRKQKEMILKVLHPELKKKAGVKNKIFFHKDCISLILNSTERDCENIEAALIKEISRFRLKVSDDVILKMNPQSILRYSADSRDLNNILYEVEALAAVSN